MVDRFDPLCGELYCLRENGELAGRNIRRTYISHSAMVCSYKFTGARISGWLSPICDPLVILRKGCVLSARCALGLFYALL
jgi:hypothetical protein